MSEHVTEKPKKNRNVYKMKREDLVVTWNKSENPEDAAASLKVPVAIVVSRVAALRKLGVQNLKEMRRSSKRVDVAALSQLASAAVENASA